ncbi:MAG: 3-phosphoshikimate 1-carboxyvinyltransferase [Anaerofustis stercorihominis]|nr:3-phosphoshikimate 1-carboxyvinyltransferase [Anaerofustis stercorihominis]
MRLTIVPSVAKGDIIAPPSKSASHRALIAGALSEKSTIYGLGESNDINATLNCLRVMGAKAELNGNTLDIGGLDPKNIPECSIDCGESGSTLRFLIPLCLMSGNPVTLRGHGRLMHRPLTEYEQLCRENGFDYILRDDSLTVCGELRGGEYKMSGERSSQFITGMMFALPLLENKSTLTITGNAQSLSYIMLTQQIIKDFGISFTRGGNTFFFGAEQKYNNMDFPIEGDYSNSAFVEAFNLMGGDVKVTGLREDSTQGDKIYREYYKKLGTDEIMDLSDCPDLAPILFAMAAVYGGKFTGTKRLRLKESDRIQAMKTELKKCGITLTDTENDVMISPEGLHSPTEVISSHNDHRIVMAMSVLLSKLGGTIDGADAVRKSWPDFFEEIGKLGITIKYE